MAPGFKGVHWALAPLGFMVQAASVLGLGVLGLVLFGVIGNAISSTFEQFGHHKPGLGSRKVWFKFGSLKVSGVRACGKCTDYVDPYIVEHGYRVEDFVTTACSLRAAQRGPQA